MNSSLAHLISHPELLSKETLYELRTLLVRYPYCQSLRLLLLKNLFLLQDSTFGDELKRSVLYVGDRRILFYLVEADKYVPLSYKTPPHLSKGFTDSEPGIDRTLTLIDAFLSNIPAEGNQKQDDEFQYVSDYTAYLENDVPQQEEQTKVQSQMRGQNLIDSFITKSEAEPMMLRPLAKRSTDEQDYQETLNNDSDSNEEDESYFTETLAKIYIKQQRYDKALEIIKKLSLKYPKKNAYFADPIRCLEKLIINVKSK